MVLVGAYDTRPAELARRSEDWQVRAYPSLGALLADEAVDAVLVLTPEAGHVPTAEAALEAGKHVLVEKPVSAHATGVNELAGAGRGARPRCDAGAQLRVRAGVRAHRAARARRGTGGHPVAPRGVCDRAPRGGRARVRWRAEQIMTHHSYLALALLGMPARVHAGVSETGLAGARSRGPGLDGVGVRRRGGGASLGLVRGG